jgi:sec-independent protein translocase protein TatA
MDALSPWHIIILLIVIVVLFGSRKLPDSARALGQAMRIFKAETKGLHHDGDDVAAGQQATAAQPTLTDHAALQQPTLQQPTPQQTGLPPTAHDATQQQILDLQRQVQDLQRQNASSDGSNGAPLAEAQRNQPSSF